MKAAFHAGAAPAIKSSVPAEGRPPSPVIPSLIAMFVGGAKHASSVAARRRRVACCLFIPLASVYFLYTVNLLLSSPSCPSAISAAAVAEDVQVMRFLSNFTASPASSPPPPPPPPPPRSPSTATGLQHIVFGIAASASLWDKRKEYIKLWWRPGRMRGYVWLDKAVREMLPRNARAAARELPALKLSSNTSSFPYTNRRGHRSAIRISRIVSETVRLRLPNVRWYVMGDDDTVFIADNLVNVLSRLDHRQPYYIGSSSESHLQNIYFSYGMAYGGGGFAISAPLAIALAKMQDGCLKRYPALYGSDDRIQACMAELGVPLTRHPGFHQFDVYGDLLGLLAAHPVAPLVSLHHLDVVQPIFPDARGGRPAALKRLLEGPAKLDPGAVMQQSICYDKTNWWTVSVSWGFAVTVVRGVMSPREIEMPARTFLNWYKRADYTAYAFNTRPVARNPCQRPHVFYLSSTRLEGGKRSTVTEYERHGRAAKESCRWRSADPATQLDRVVVMKRPDPDLWNRAPRRNCCRVVTSPSRRSKTNKTMAVEVGVCRDGEYTQI